MLHKLVSPADIPQLGKPYLGNDGPEFPARSRYSMRSRPIPSRERLTRYNESGRVRPKVLEEVGEAVEEDEGVSRGLRLVEGVEAEA